jgi:hypothetical protein
MDRARATTLLWPHWLASSASGPPGSLSRGKLLYQYDATGEKGLIAEIEEATIRSVNAMALSTIVLALQTCHVEFPDLSSSFVSSEGHRTFSKQLEAFKAHLERRA